MGHLSGFSLHWVQTFGYTGVFLAMVLESACIPLPSEVIMPFGGYLAAVGHLSLWTVIVAGTVGNVVGSWIAYAVGRLGGRPLLARYGRVVRLSERHLEAAEAWFAKHGEWAVFVGRLLPGIRTFISLPAGIARMPVAKFTVYTAIGSLPWAGLLAYGGFKLGQNWDTVSHYTKPLMAIAVLVIVALIVYIAIRVRRGRRA